MPGLLVEIFRGVELPLQVAVVVVEPAAEPRKSVIIGHDARSTAVRVTARPTSLTFPTIEAFTIQH
jgi:hypothetical protein